jgi:SAM-dependent methyltransferase
MDRSRIIPAQVPYWDSVAGEKRFFHPLRLAWLTRHLGSSVRILDFGCGYGRTLAELLCAGHEDVIGVDFSFRMLTCCRSQLPDVRLILNYGQTIPLQKHSVDLVLLFAVLTCIPRDEDQRALLREIMRVLRPGGLLYISDLLRTAIYGISKGTTVTQGNTGPTESSSSQKAWLCVIIGKSGSRS